jgi:hypothetical protein
VSACGTTNAQGACVGASGSANTTGLWVGALIATVAAVGGIVLIVNNSKTSINVETTAGPPPESWLRTPSWQQTAVERQAPPVIGVPLLSGHF